MSSTKTSKTSTYSTYSTRGPVRGCCGHRHRSLTAAAECAAADQRACERTGGYSDRVAHRADGADLSVAEHDEWMYLFDAQFA